MNKLLLIWALLFATDSFGQKCQCYFADSKVRPDQQAICFNNKEFVHYNNGSWGVITYHIDSVTQFDTLREHVNVFNITPFAYSQDGIEHRGSATKYYVIDNKGSILINWEYTPGGYGYKAIACKPDANWMVKKCSDALLHKNSSLTKR